jgi:hypothetical protein
MLESYIAAPWKEGARRDGTLTGHDYHPRHYTSWERPAAGDQRIDTHAYDDSASLAISLLSFGSGGFIFDTTGL